jgi:hypothetical protein
VGGSGPSPSVLGASPGSSGGKASARWLFGRGPLIEFRLLLTLTDRSGLRPQFPARLSCCPAFRRWGASMASPTTRTTMPSADFCGAVGAPCGALSPVAGTSRRSPEVSSTAFVTHPPDLQGPPLDGWGLRDPPLARPDGPASYPVFVHRVVALLHASFRRRLAEPPLRFASTSPPSGCAGDLHPQAVEHARHTVAGTTRRLGGEATGGCSSMPPDQVRSARHRRSVLLR